MSDEEMDSLADASARWSGEFGCEVSFDGEQGTVHASVDGQYAGSWKSLTDAESGIARLWMISTR